MLENKQDYSGQTISQLNNIRKGLLLEVKNLRQRQGDILDKLYQEVVLEQDDIAENYFSPGNSSNGKYFSQRLENCMRAMKVEVKKLEESVGAQLGEVEEELDSSLLRLASKEKELENLKNQIQGPAKASKEYKELLHPLLQSLPDPVHATANDTKLLSLLDWKRQYEMRLNTIIDSRTTQLEREISSAVAQLHAASEQLNVGDTSAQNKPRRIEIYSQAVNKAIDAQLQTQHQLVDAERDRLLKQHFLDQMSLHKSFVSKYNAIKAVYQEEDDLEKKKKGYHRNPLRMQQQQSIHSVQASSHISVLPSSTSTTEESRNNNSSNNNNHPPTEETSPYNPSFLLVGRSWRAELLDVLESQLEDSSLQLANSHTAHEQWLSSFTRPVDIPPTTMVDYFAQQPPLSTRRSSAAAGFFTDADTLPPNSARSLEEANAFTRYQPGGGDNASFRNTPSSLLSPGVPHGSLLSPSGMTSPAVTEKLVSKQYEDIVVKLAHVYQRYNDGRVVPLVPQEIPQTDRPALDMLNNRSTATTKATVQNSSTDNILKSPLLSPKESSMSPYRGFYRK